jgi:hypothetical protein
MDGALVSTGTYLVGNGFANSSEPLTIGSLTWGNNLTGLMDEVQLYDQALTAAQISAIMYY